MFTKSITKCISYSSILLTLLIGFVFLPVVAQAQTFAYAESLANQSGGIISILLTVVVALALLLFFWGLAIFILNADDESKRAEGRQRMVWGIIALFVIVAVWGIVEILRNIFDVDSEDDFSAPGVAGNALGGANPASGAGSGSATGGQNGGIGVPSGPGNNPSGGGGAPAPPPSPTVPA